MVTFILLFGMFAFLLWAKWYKEYIIEKNTRRYLRYIKRKWNT